MRITPGNWRFTEMKPLHRVELPWIEFNCKAAVGIDHVPERNIGMARRDTDGFGRSQHQWCFGNIAEVESQLLSQLAYYCGSRMFTRLNMPTARQPKLCVPMVHE